MIKEIIENECGIVNLETYEGYKLEKFTSLTDEDVQKLSPDNINSADFWRWAAKSSSFAKDAICNGGEKYSIEECKLVNLLLAIDSGVLNKLLGFGITRSSNRKVLEIGAGFGQIKELCNQSNIGYTGVDLVPRCEGIYEIEDGDTKIPDFITEVKYDLILSTNVFQHLSRRQRISYYKQASSMLKPDGCFSFNIVIDDGLVGFRNGDKSYMCHYGQYTELQPLQSIATDLVEYFKVKSYTITNQILATFTCTLK